MEGRGRGKEMGVDPTNFTRKSTPLIMTGNE